jgi:hypothetical protein
MQTFVYKDVSIKLAKWPFWGAEIAMISIDVGETICDADFKFKKMFPEYLDKKGNLKSTISVSKYV